MIAGIARVLIQKDMEAADDDGYTDYSKAMGTATRRLIFATKGGEFEEAVIAVNQLEQSCDNCHEEWR